MSHSAYLGKPSSYVLLLVLMQDTGQFSFVLVNVTCLILLSANGHLYFRRGSFRWALPKASEAKPLPRKLYYTYNKEPQNSEANYYGP